MATATMGPEDRIPLQAAGDLHGGGNHLLNQDALHLDVWIGFADAGEHLLVSVFDCLVAGEAEAQGAGVGLVREAVGQDLERDRAFYGACGRGGCVGGVGDDLAAYRDAVLGEDLLGDGLQHERLAGLALEEGPCLVDAGLVGGRRLDLLAAAQGFAERGDGADRADGARRVDVDRDAGGGDVGRGQGGRHDQRLVGGSPDLLGRVGLPLADVPHELQHRVDAARGGQAAVDRVEVLHVEVARGVHRVGGAAEAREQALQVLPVGVGEDRHGETARLGHVGHQRGGAPRLGHHAEPVAAHPSAGLQGQAEVDHLLHAGGLDQAVLPADRVVDNAGAGDRRRVAQHRPRAFFCVARLDRDHGLAEFGGAFCHFDEGFGDRTASKKVSTMPTPGCSIR